MPRPYSKNAKKHPDAQLKLIAKSLKEYGWRQPIVVDKNDEIIVGHGRWAAYEKYPEGIKEPWIVTAEDLTPEQVKGYRLMDNKSNESEWDMDLAIEELKELNAAGFDIELTGFDKDLLIEPDAQDDVIPENVPPTTKLGDLYLLGNHRVLCGDATKREDVERLMDGKKADMVFTDPPYGINYKSPSGSGLTKRGNYDVLVNDDKEFEPTCLFGWADKVVSWGANHYAHKLPPSKMWLVWDKREGDAINNNSDCELAWCSFGGSARLFHHKWNGMIKASERNERRQHPTQKPVQLATWVFQQTDAGTLILDPFLGSGSTLIAAEKTGRICYGMELDPKYVDVIVKRWENYTGNTAIKL